MNVGNAYEFYQAAGRRIEGENPDFPEIGPRYQAVPDEVDQIRADLCELGINIPVGIEKRFNKLIGYYSWAKNYYNS
jgi:hypothetical protein